MAPRTPEQFHDIRENRKQQIMEAALLVFANDGYHSASIAKIAKAANISKGLLYNYFESKEQLLIAVLTEGVEQIHSIMNQLDDELDTPEELWIFIRGSLELIKSKPEFFKLYFSLIFQTEVTHVLSEKYQQIVGPMMDDIAVYFKTKGEANPEEKAFMLGIMLDGIGMHYVMNPQAIDLDKMEKIVFDLFK